MGSLKGTPLQTLETEAGEMPLDLRRKMLSLKFRILMEKDETHSLYKNLKDCWQYHYSHNKIRPSFGQRTKHTENIDLFEPSEPNLCKKFPFPPWKFHAPNISLELTSKISKKDHPSLLLQLSLEMINTKWSNYMHAYTDGSKFPDTGRTTAAFHIPYYGKTEAKRLQNHISIYRAELISILLLLTWVNNQNIQLYTGIVIFSDSLSALQALNNTKDENTIKEILFLSTQLFYKGINIHLEWIPSHCGIKGNESVDQAAKNALQNIQIDIPVRLNKQEIKSILKKQYVNEWQIRWNESTSFLQYIHKKVSKPYECKIVNRKNEITLYRLRSGNLGLNCNLQKIGKHETGLCPICKVPETTQHFLSECTQYIIPRSMLLTDTNTNDPNNIILLLSSESSSDQKALVEFVYRSQRFYE